MSSSKAIATLALADGTVFVGTAFGACTSIVGEVVFNTALTGTVELMTDPSYRHQILTQTVTEVGNVGVARVDVESERIQVSGLIVRSLSPLASNWRSDVTLHDWMVEEGIPGIADIDTRALVLHIRDHGAMMGVLSTEHKVASDAVDDVKRAQSEAPMQGRSLVSEVTVGAVTSWTEGLLEEDGAAIAPLRAAQKHVVAIDLGMKRSIARLLVHHGCRVTIVPASTTADEILALKPDGIFLSNGPGDPSQEQGVVDNVRSLLGKKPIFGICMGHQMLSQAFGAETFKTKFGHRGGNQPVQGDDGRVLITSQNHGFAVDARNLNEGAKEAQVNVSDGTNEGMHAPDFYAFSVQYHPESAPGPHDARPHFEEFIHLMERFVDEHDSQGAQGTGGEG